MNLQKERTEVGKIITTLFICGSLLVGFMGMSLSLTQTAMAQPQGPPEGRPPQDPQCPDDAIRFERGQCIVESERHCEGLGEDFVLNPENELECIAPAEPELVCPEGAGELDEESGLCKELPDCPATHPYNTVRDRCERPANPPGTPGGPCPAANDEHDPLGPGNADNVCYIVNRDLCDPGELVDDVCVSQPDEECPEGARETDEGGCEFFEPSRERCPGGGEPIAGECPVRPGNRGAA
jgi:hypothetical protein